MSASLGFLDLVATALPRIKQTLDEHEWADFTGQLQPCSRLFQNVSSEAGLDVAVDQLAIIIAGDDRISSLLTEPTAVLGDWPSHSGSRKRGLPSEQLAGADIATISRQFYLLCSDPEAFVRQEV